MGRVREKEEEGEEMEEGSSPSSDLQSWLRRFFRARGCDDSGEEEELVQFLTCLFKGGQLFWNG